MATELVSRNPQQREGAECRAALEGDLLEKENSSGALRTPRTPVGALCVQAAVQGGEGALPSRFVEIVSTAALEAGTASTVR